MPRVFLADLAEKVKSYGVFASLSRHPALYFVHFTDLQADLKTQFFPGSQFDTPVGLYSYPITGPNGLSSLSRFATDRKYVSFFTLNTFSNVVRSSKYSESDLEHDLKKLQAVFPAAFPGLVEQWTRAAIVQTPAGKLWNVTRLLAEKKVQKWRALFLQVLGIDGWIDENHEGIIHVQEPSQAVFFNPRVLKPVAFLANPLGGNLSAPRSQEEALIYHYAPEQIVQKHQRRREETHLSLQKAKAVTGREALSKLFDFSFSDPGTVTFSLASSTSYIVTENKRAYLFQYQLNTSKHTKVSSYIKYSENTPGEKVIHDFREHIAPPEVLKRCRQHSGVPQMLSLNGWDVHPEDYRVESEYVSVLTSAVEKGLGSEMAAQMASRYLFFKFASQIKAPVSLSAVYTGTLPGRVSVDAWLGKEDASSSARIVFYCGPVGSTPAWVKSRKEDQSLFGKNVTVTVGPFAGFTGAVSAVRARPGEKSAIGVDISIFGRVTQLFFGREDLKFGL